MATTDPLPDSYAHIPFKLRKAITITLDPNDLQLIHAVAARHGILQQINANYISAICTELRARGITYYTPDNFAAFISLIQRRTAPWTPGQGLLPNDSSGENGTHPSPPSPPNQCPNPPRRTGNKVSRTKKGI